MVWLPSVKAEVLKLACPLLLRFSFVARVVAPSVKVTVPSVTGLLPLSTVAVNVTLLPNNEGFRSEVTVVVVGTFGGETTKFKHLCQRESCIGFR